MHLHDRFFRWVHHLEVTSRLRHWAPKSLCRADALDGAAGRVVVVDCVYAHVSTANAGVSAASSVANAGADWLPKKLKNRRANFRSIATSEQHAFDGSNKEP